MKLLLAIVVVLTALHTGANPLPANPLAVMNATSYPLPHCDPPQNSPVANTLKTIIDNFSGPISKTVIDELWGLFIQQGQMWEAAYEYIVCELWNDAVKADQDWLNGMLNGYRDNLDSIHQLDPTTELANYKSQLGDLNDDMTDNMYEFMQADYAQVTIQYFSQFVSLHLSVTAELLRVKAGTNYKYEFDKHYEKYTKFFSDHLPTVQKWRADFVRLNFYHDPVSGTCSGWGEDVYPATPIKFAYFGQSLHDTCYNNNDNCAKCAANTNAAIAGYQNEMKQRIANNLAQPKNYWDQLKRKVDG
jgi:hypothetical protein